MIKPSPTKTFVLDVGRRCNINCRFCYYHHLGDLRKQTFRDIASLTADIDRGIQRGNNYMDVTGGETTIHPQITDIIKRAVARNVRTCLITNGLVGEERLEKIIEAGVDEFLVSVHGLEEVHDYLTQQPGAHKLQEKFLSKLSQYPHIKLRFNLVITKFNQHQLVEISEWMAQWNPHIVNFINMNLHHEWKNDSLTAKDLIADLRMVEPELDTSIAYLESKDVGVNVRYYPMCRLDPLYRRCVSNDLHVCFDPYEWDYNLPKNFQHIRDFWIDESNKVEEKGAPCNVCDLQWICGGANKYFHETSNMINEEVLTAQAVPSLKDKNDFYFYRQHNTRTLGER